MHRFIPVVCRRRMRTPTALLTAVAAMAMLAGSAAAADTNAAGKEPFFRITAPAYPSCNGPSDETLPADHSFAIIRSDGRGDVSSEVHLQNLEPNTVYHVGLIGVQDPMTCRLIAAQLVTTNGQGNANVSVSGPDSYSAFDTGALVYLTSVTFRQTTQRVASRFRVSRVAEVARSPRAFPQSLRGQRWWTCRRRST